jgi:hypothetical protein
METLVRANSPITSPEAYLHKRWEATFMRLLWNVEVDLV